MTSASKPAAAGTAAEAILDRIRELLMGFDLDWRCTYLNRSAREYAQMLGLSGDALIGQVVWDAIPELRDSPFYQAAIRPDLGTGDQELEALIPSLGRVLAARFVRTEEGFVVHARDVTEQRRGEADARRERELIRTIMAQTGDAIYAKDAEGRYMLLSAGARAALERDGTSMMGRTDGDLLAPESAALVRAHDLEVMATGEPLGVEEVLRFQSGEEIIFQSSKAALHAADGTITGVIGFSHDISERKREEGRLRLLSEASQAFTSTLQMEDMVTALARLVVPDVADCCLVDLVQPGGEIRRVRAAHRDPQVELQLEERLRRMPPRPGGQDLISQVLGTADARLRTHLAPADWDRFAESDEQRSIWAQLAPESLLSVPLVAGGDVLGALTLLQGPGGRRLGPADLTLVQHLADRAALSVANARLFQSVRDELAQRVRAEALSMRWSHIFEHASWGIAIGSVADRKFELVNPAFAEMHGYTPDQLAGQPLEILTVPEQRPLVPSRIQVAIDQGRVVYEARRLRRDGSTFPARVEVTAVRSEMGDVLHLAANVQDLSEWHRAETQVREAQKMEALGRLAVGVSHDFNNMLMIIVGFADFLASAMSEDDVRRGDAVEIRKAAERAAALTQQLMAFGRPKPPTPELLDLNEVVAGMRRMLQPMMGEAITVELDLAEGLGGILADRGQLEQVILNLALNARDSMPGGGELRLRTRAGAGRTTALLDESEPVLDGGRAVVLEVRDTGHGMDETTQARIFEPFFSTRSGRGHSGLGLGLAVAYRIMRQAGGRIWVTSAPGEGSTFSLRFPETELPAVPAAPARLVAPRGREQILVVEDESPVRELVHRTLADAGYAVTTAASGELALEQLAGGVAGDLVLADVVLPGISGGEFATRLAEVAPGLPVIFMSGYGTQELEARGFTPREGAYLQKPFSAERLLQQVRAVLDAADPGAHRA
ncbi:MAG TPA: PAS domain-containing protein [Gemmatimonadales bacterium]|nr:PAS domain-containing protein [Gemmatimonadales bacterium]